MRESSHKSFEDANGLIYGQEFFCVGGVTIHGIIGTRDYDHTTYEYARGRYLTLAKFRQIELALTNEQMLEKAKRKEIL